jgi:hypothetical protein
MSACTLCLSEGPSPSTRVHSRWFANDKSIGDELADGLTGVGVANLVHFIRIKPDLALPTADDGSC